MIKVQPLGFTGLEILVVLIIIGVVGGGTVTASDNAKPGDALFGLDLAIENLQERLANDPVQKLELKINQIRERHQELEEIGEELEKKKTAQVQKNLERASTLASNALSQATTIVSDLAENIQASEQSQAQETLERVTELLQDLQTQKENTISTLTEIKSEVTSNEAKQKIEVLTQTNNQQMIRVEEKIEEDGSIQQRVKVYATVNGEEIKILDLENENGQTKVKSIDDESDDMDDLLETEEEDNDESEISAEKFEIKWEDSRFKPSQITIQEGDYVEFENEDDSLIRIASNPHPAHTDLPNLDSGNLEEGAEYEYTFTQTGTWQVHNHLQPDQTATIVVE